MSAKQVVELLNFQWIHGEPSKSLDRAGVLVHVFDNTEASEPWLPCPQTSWCARFGDRISASMINQHLPGMFAANGFPPTGIVLSSQLTRVLCSYFADGGSMNKQCDGPPTEGCVPGCIDKFHHWCDSRDVRVFDRNVDVYHCAYTPEDLDAMLQRHLDSYGVSGVRRTKLPRGLGQDGALVVHVYHNRYWVLVQDAREGCARGPRAALCRSWRSGAARP
jgi:hypothetical protein